MRVVDRAAKHEAVSLSRLSAKLVHDVTKGALPRLGAAPARSAAALRLGTDPKDLRLHAVCLQGAGDLLERAVRASRLVRASVHEHDLHKPLLLPMPLPGGRLP